MAVSDICEYVFLALGVIGFGLIVYGLFFSKIYSLLIIPNFILYCYVSALVYYALIYSFNLLYLYICSLDSVE